MSTIHDVFLFDTEGTLQLIVQGWETLSYTQKLDDAWYHNIKLELSSDDADRVSVLRDNLDVDWIIQIYRTDEIAKRRDLVYSGFNRTVVDQARTDGTLIFTLYGVGFTELLKRRVVVPGAGEESSSKTGVAGDIMHEFVDEQAINPDDGDRSFPGLTGGEGAGVGGDVTYTARYTNLFTVITSCSEDGEVHFGIIQESDDEVIEFSFIVRDVWGDDRREDNLEGNTPAIFSMEMGNMLIPIQSRNASEERNFVYVGGQGVGAARQITTVQDSERIELSPWNRREGFVDARLESTNDGLITAGQDNLRKFKAKNTLSFNVRQTESSRWLEHWGLGDRITSYYFDSRFDQTIIEVGVAVTAGSDSTTEGEIELINIETELYEE